MPPRGRKVGPQKSSIFAGKHVPKRQTFPEWMLAQERAKAEAAKRVGHQVT